jgi:hypothetical protein
MVFRCGHNGLLRLNFKQTIDFYNTTISGQGLTNTADINWRKAEFKFDWKAREVTYYFNNENDESVVAPFYYQNIEDANGLMFYNLKPGSVSYFKDVVVSSVVPEARASGANYKIKIMAILGLFLVLLKN